MLAVAAAPPIPGPELGGRDNAPARSAAGTPKTDREGSPRVTIHAVAFTDRDADGRVASIRVYQDLAPRYG